MQTTLWVYKVQHKKVGYQKIKQELKTKEQLVSESISMLSLSGGSGVRQQTAHRAESIQQKPERDYRLPSYHDIFQFKTYGINHSRQCGTGTHRTISNKQGA